MYLFSELMLKKTEMGAGLSRIITAGKEPLVFLGCKDRGFRVCFSNAVAIKEDGLSDAEGL